MFRFSDDLNAERAHAGSDPKARLFSRGATTVSASGYGFPPLDPALGSGATSASRDKFPRAILPRSFDYGFATGLMVKDVRLYLDEAEALGVPIEVAETVGRLWEAAQTDQGPQSDFTSVIKPFEKAAGVVVGRPPSD